MLPIEKVLVPIDSSEPSKKAFRYGLSLAIELKATLVLGNVVPLAPALEYAYSVEDHGLSEADIGQIRTKLESWVDAESRQFSEPRVVVKAGGDVKDGVLAIISEEAPDLVVMGTYGRRQSRSGLDRAQVGSTAERVVRGAHVPVLSIPPAPQETQ